MPKIMPGLLPRLLAVGLSLALLAGGIGPARAGEPFRVKLKVTADEAMKTQVIRHLHRELGLLEDVMLVVDEAPDFVLSVLVEGTDDTLSALPQYAVSVVALETGNGAACYAVLERCQCAKGFNPGTPGDTGFLAFHAIATTPVDYMAETFESLVLSFDGVALQKRREMLELTPPPAEQGVNAQ
jgi:hypothetical protein